MRILIDGYNVMHARGLLGQRFGPDGFRKARTRFLNDLAGALGPIDAHQTTIVFDAATPPAEFPKTTTHKGIAVVFAVDAESADEQIEAMIASHTSPKLLTVVSSDHRIRKAAARRKARGQTADEFLDSLENRRRRVESDAAAPVQERSPRDRQLSPEEAAHWLDEFREIEDDPEMKLGLERDRAIPTDAEIAEIEREVEREFGL